ncbi:MAG: amino acid ABC transporter permease [Oscillospiraceae bacterium]
MDTIWQDIVGALITEDRWKMYLNGLGYTLLIAAVGCAIGIIIGLLVATAKIYASGSKNPLLKILSFVANLYTTVIRGIPVMVQLLIIWGLMSASTRPVTVAIIGFGINSGAYVSEIFRAGINSVDSGQMEAGRSLGLSRNSTMRLIILPQAVKNILPSLFNEFISLVKETSVAGYIAVGELTKQANAISTRTFNLWSLYIAAIIYLVVVYLLTIVQKIIEKRLARSDRS